MSRSGRSNEHCAGPLGGGVVPLPVALRLDMTLQTEGRGPISATKITWFSPKHGTRETQGMEIILLPN